MITPPAIIDTNVVVSGLIGGRADSPVAQILDGMLAAHFAYAVSDALIDEYRAVLLRPRLRKAHGLDGDEVDILLVEIAAHAIVLVTPQSPMHAPDPGDQHLWDLLDSHEQLVLVTGDALLQSPGPMTSRVMTPQAFVSIWRA